MNRTTLTTIIASLLLAACAAALVPETSHTPTKVGYVRDLLDLGRPIPAERMLREVMATTPVNSEDWVAYGEAHVLYSMLIASEWFATAPAVHDQYEAYGGTKGILKKYRELLQLAEAAYLKADTIFANQQDDFARSNIRWRLAGVYARLGDKSKTCSALDESLQFHITGHAKFPNQVVAMPKQYAGATYQTAIKREKQNVGCG